MKKLLPIILIAMAVSACDVYVVEPRYDRRDALAGYYDVKEYSETYGDYTYYSIRVAKAGTYDEIWLDNFYGADIRVLAYIDGDRITIPFQIVDGYEVEGGGNIYYGDLHLDYSVYDRYQQGPTDYCHTDAWSD